MVEGGRLHEILRIKASQFNFDSNSTQNGFGKNNSEEPSGLASMWQN